MGLGSIPDWRRNEIENAVSGGFETSLEYLERLETTAENLYVKTDLNNLGKEVRLLKKIISTYMASLPVNEEMNPLYERAKKAREHVDTADPDAHRHKQTSAGEMTLEVEDEEVYVLEEAEDGRTITRALTDREKKALNIDDELVGTLVDASGNPLREKDEEEEEDEFANPNIVFPGFQETS